MQAIDDLKSKVKKFEKPIRTSEKQRVLETLKGVVNKRALSAMSLSDAIDVLVTVMELPFVQSLTKSGETITLAELTRKPRKTKEDGEMAEADDDGEEDGAENEEPEDDEDLGDEDEE